MLLRINIFEMEGRPILLEARLKHNRGRSVGRSIDKPSIGGYTHKNDDLRAARIPLLLKQLLRFRDSLVIRRSREAILTPKTLKRERREMARFLSVPAVDSAFYDPFPKTSLCCFPSDSKTTVNPG
jgi:hypothetical protein